MEIFRIGTPPERWGAALEIEGGESLMTFMHAVDFDPTAPFPAHSPAAGSTPLTLALEGPNGASVGSRKVDTILAAGADPDASDGRGRLPIVLAARYGRAEHLRTLVAHGARVGVVDGRGETPLDGVVARSEEAHAGAAVLLSLEGTPDQAAERRSRADRVSAERRRDDDAMITVLLDHGLDPCAIVRPPSRKAPIEEPLSARLAERGLADLAERAATACRAKRAAE